VNGGQPQVLGTFTAPQLLTNDSTCSSNSPVFETFSLANFQAETITLRFEATSTGSDQAIANFDNIFVGGGG